MSMKLKGESVIQQSPQTQQRLSGHVQTYKRLGWNLSEELGMEKARHHKLMSKKTQKKTEAVNMRDKEKLQQSVR